MAANYVQLPDDSGNTGKKVRTWQRTVGANDTEEHFFHQAHGETSGLANVAANAASVTLRAASQSRLGLIIYNDSADSQLYVKLGATASVTSFSSLVPPRGEWVLGVPYAGVVDGIWTNPSGGAVSGDARVTEITP